MLAVFHSGVLHPGLVLRKTAVLSASGSIAVLLFVTLEAAITEVLAGTVGTESRLGSIVSGAVAGLALRPLTARLDRLTRRLGDEFARSPSGD